MSISTPAPAETRVPEARPRRAGRLRRWGLRASGGLLALVLLAAAITALLDARDARRFPAPGDLVELADGRMLHLQVAGEQHEGPTVVLDAGFGAFSPAFAWVRQELAQVATTVAYDRPGYGWSDPTDGPVDAEAVVDDLRAALAARSLPGPYVLVGHSLGAHYARVFAGRFPEDVAGLVLLDPSHEDQFERLPDSAAQMEQLNRTLTWAPRLARLGLFRIYNPQGKAIADLPEAAAAHAAAKSITAGFMHAYAREGRALLDIAAAVPPHFGSVPVRVVSASVPEPDGEAPRALQDELHRELVARSGLASHHVVPQAAHVTLITEARHARAVTRIIDDLLREIRPVEEPTA
jgi:pimeloyl-ACP methyl ester carboxylesterase